MKPINAVILAAGMGTRLQSILGDLPKPLIRLGGRTLIERSLDRLEKHGLESLTVVVGHGGAKLRSVLLHLRPQTRIVENPEPWRNGSMRSLALAREALGQECPTNVLVAEADILFGPEALEELGKASGGDGIVLTSSPTGVGDEVWVCGRGEQISEIAKVPVLGVPPIGELVGLSLFSRHTLDLMAEGHLSAGADAEMEHYEERLSILAGRLDVRARLVEGLVWTEIDDPDQLRRAEAEILPALEGL